MAGSQKSTQSFFSVRRVRDSRIDLGNTHIMYVRSHEKLIVWQESYQFCLWMYTLTQKFPMDERFGLTNQMRRSAYSVPTNIAEGNTKHSPKEKRHFFEISHASLEELHCQCRLSCDLHYISVKEMKEADDHINRISYLLSQLSASLRAPPRTLRTPRILRNP